MTTISRVMYKRDHYAIQRDGADIIGLQVLTDLPNVHGLLDAIRLTIARFYGYEPGDEIGGRVEWHKLGWDSQADHDAMWRDVLALVPEHDPEQRERIRDAVRAARAAGTLPAEPPYSVTQLDALDRIVRATTAPKDTQP